MKTVFLIDDDDDDREIFEEAIRSLPLDLNLQQAINGVDALDKLRASLTIPDLIFLDLNMPKMDGREFLRHIKQIIAYAHIPVIIYSTSSNSRDVEFTTEHGAVRFMVKHHSITALKEDLEQALKQFLF